MSSTDNPRFTALMDYMRTKLCAEYEASDALKAEFTSAEGYVAYTLNSDTAKPLVRKWRETIEETENLAALHAVEVRRNVQKADARRAAGRLRVTR